MGEACSVHGSAYKNLVRKPEGKGSLGRPICRQKDNIKMDLKECVRMWSGSMSQDREHWQDL
jgi:hypothetical protein